MTSKGCVLVIEDNKKLNIANIQALKMRGYSALTALTLAEAREQLLYAAPDVILLDVMLPDGDGFEFCEEIQGKSDAHIIFLTAKTNYVDRLRGLKGGGKDYMTKPFNLEELIARIDIQMQFRREKGVLNVISIGGLTLDNNKRQAFFDGRELMLEAKCFSLLNFFVQNKDKEMQAEYLYEKIWGRPMEGDKQAIKSAISRLRKKIEPSGYTIRFVRNRGYIFEMI